MVGVLQAHIDPFVSIVTNGTQQAILITAPEQNSSQETIDQFLMWSCSNICSLFEYACQKNSKCIVILPQLENNFAPYAQEARYTQSLDCLKAASYAYQQTDALDVSFINYPKIYATHYVTKALSVLLSQASNKRTRSISELTYTIGGEAYSDNEITIRDIDFEYVQPQQALHVAQRLPELPCAVITGGAGSLGRPIVQELLQRNYRVIVLDNFVCSRVQDLAHFESYNNFEWYEHDVAIPFDIEGSVDLVIHAASIPSPKYYYALPVETYKSGTSATINTLELARQKKARYILCSTSEIYGKAEISPQPEWYSGKVSAFGLRAPYDQSKRGSETLAGLYEQQFTIDTRIIRIFNTYGPDMALDDGRVITNFIQAMLDNKPIKINGTGEQTRSFNYITDTIADIMAITLDNELEGPIENKVFNVGSTHEITVNALATIIQEQAQQILGKIVPIEHIPVIDHDDPMQRKPDLQKFNQRYGTRKTIGIIEGISHMLQFYAFSNNSN